LALVIEVDGDSHLTEDAKTYDDVREKYFEGLNIKTARFKNDEVLLDVEMVLQKIKDYFV
jgi:very-short-patch-repair endonuclease